MGFFCFFSLSLMFIVISLYIRSINFYFLIIYEDHQSIRIDFWWPSVAWNFHWGSCHDRRVSSSPCSYTPFPSLFLFFIHKFCWSTSVMVSLLSPALILCTHKPTSVISILHLHVFKPYQCINLTLIISRAGQALSVFRFAHALLVFWTRPYSSCCSTHF